IALGLIFLAPKIIPGLSFGKFIWPAMIIGFGIWLLLGKRNPFRSDKRYYDIPDHEKKDGYWASGDPSSSDFSQARDINTDPYIEGADSFESVSVFGGVKKNVLSKKFRGGEIVNIFGGAEINFMQADIQGVVKIEVVQIFGGTKIIVPANWTVHSEMAAVFGGIEDKRPPQLNQAHDKVLIIEGTSIFGGIDIKSF